MAETVGLFEAKTHFSELVARAEAGQEVIITRHNKPVAKLGPVTPPMQDARSRHEQAVMSLLAFRKRHKLGGIDAKTLVEDGRKR
jgi:prevent-host-death family protein